MSKTTRLDGAVARTQRVSEIAQAITGIVVAVAWLAQATQALRNLFRPKEEPGSDK